MRPQHGNRLNGRLGIQYCYFNRRARRLILIRLNCRLLFSLLSLFWRDLLLNVGFITNASLLFISFFRFGSRTGVQNGGSRDARSRNRFAPGNRTTITTRLSGPNPTRWTTMTFRWIWTWKRISALERERHFSFVQLFLSFFFFNLWKIPRTLYVSTLSRANIIIYTLWLFKKKTKKVFDIYKYIKGLCGVYRSRRTNIYIY